MSAYGDLFVRERINFDGERKRSRVRYIDYKKTEKQILEWFRYGLKDAKVTHDLYNIKSNVKMHGTITGRFSARSKVA